MSDWWMWIQLQIFLLFLLCLLVLLFIFWLLTPASDKEGYTDVTVALWLQTLWPCTCYARVSRWNSHLSDTSFFSMWVMGQRQATGASHQAPSTPDPSPPLPSKWSPIMSRGGNDVPLKSILNQIQLIPLLSLIISIVEPSPRAGLLSRTQASVKVTLGQAK